MGHLGPAKPAKSEHPAYQDPAEDSAGTWIGGLLFPEEAGKRALEGRRPP